MLLFLPSELQIESRGDSYVGIDDRYASNEMLWCLIDR